MATSTIAFVILLLTLSSTIHARESQFFSKFSSNNVKETPTLNKNNNNNQQTPDLVPQSQETSESFGHESGQLSPSATTTTTNNNNNNNNYYNNNNLPSYLPKNYNPVAYTTPIHSNTQEFNDPQTYNSESELYNSQNQEEFVETNGDNTYNTEKQGMSDTRYLENGKYYYNGGDANTYNSPKQGFEDARFMETEDVGNTYNSEKQEVGETKYSTSNNANLYNNERQGMSDTRFLENGKYYYDLNMENVNNANANSRNEYNTQGYYGNNGNSYDNSYDRYNSNSNGGYQNQEEFQVDQFNP